MADDTAVGEPDDEQGATVVPLHGDRSAVSPDADDPEFSTRVPPEPSEADERDEQKKA